jgi:hypothetical protein
VIGPDPQLVRQHLEKLLRSEQLAKTDTSSKLLSYLAERSLRGEAPKETEIAFDVFGKDPSFSGAEHSIVRVSVRTLRQKLGEYYAGSGRNDELRFEIPKGGYRLTASRNEHVPAQTTAVSPEATSQAAAASPTAAGVAPTPGSPAMPAASGELATSVAATLPAPESSRPTAVAPVRWKWLAVASLAVLAVSAGLNLYSWSRPAGSVAAPDAPITRVRDSALWSDMVKSNRPVTLILGDLFMYTQIDPKTGRTVTVRDSAVNSSEELRAFLANNPSFATERGQRYVTMVQKTVAVGMASVMRIIDRPGRRIEVVAQDDVSADAIRNNDVIYLGPLVRLGALGSHYALQSRYRFNSEAQMITDLATGKSFMPEGSLSDQHVDYALAARFLGPTGNHIVILTAGARNAGVLQIVRMVTSAEGVAKIDERLRADHHENAASFEALLTVTGFKQTDLMADLVNVTPMPARAAHLQNTAAANAGTR